MLTDEQIEQATSEIGMNSPLARWKIARAIESAATAPLLAEIERLKESVKELEAQAFRDKTAANYWKGRSAAQQRTERN